MPRPFLRRLVQQLAVSHAVWITLLVVQLYQMYLNASAQGHLSTFADNARGQLGRYWSYAILTPVIYWLSTRYPFDRGRRLISIIAQVCGYVVIGAAYSYLRIWTLRLIGPPRPGLTYSYLFAAMFKGLLSEQIWMYVAVVLASHMVHYYANARERAVQEERLRAELAESKLRILKLQLHPHFLFNTLNGISALMTSDVRLARTMIAELSDLLRTALKHAGVDEIPLKEELDFIQAYLHLQKMRLGERLQVSVRVDPDLLTCSVPSMVLQPIVENGIRHGIERLEQGGRLEISVSRHDHMMTFCVLNDGPTLAEAQATSGTGVGLKNIKERLLSLCGAFHNLTIGDRESGGVSVTFDVPIVGGELTGG